jgi:hypothetical protein
MPEGIRCELSHGAMHGAQDAVFGQILRPWRESSLPLPAGPMNGMSRDSTVRECARAIEC